MCALWAHKTPNPWMCVFQRRWLPGNIQLQHLNLLQRWKTPSEFESAPVGPFWLFVSEGRRNAENRGNVYERKILGTFIRTAVL